jgi:hypothetical protein
VLKRLRPPPPGGESVQVLEPTAPPLPAGVPVVNLIPVGDGGPAPLLPDRRKRRAKKAPLCPTPQEVQRLPRTARAAYLARVADRVAPLGARVADAAAAAAVLVQVATDPAELLWFRRDFDRLAKLARKHHWTDDTPVPPSVFGPLWPKGRTPDWAKPTS